ncbi:MAG: (Fe-S)-binding protein [Nitrospirae bacterium]|nr:(Fe-S)-binding protein [Nitrospirota bacterium]
MLKDYLHKIKLCAACPKMCRFACPVAEVEKKERVTPWGKSLTALLVLEDNLSYDDPDVVDTFYSCCMCKRCKSYCLVDDVDIPAMIQAGREEIAAAKKEPEEIKIFLENFKKFNNPFGKELKLPPHPSLSPEGRGLRKGGSKKEKINLLDKAGQGYGIFSDCCGFPLWASGYTEDARGFMTKVKEAFLSSGARKIIASCPACAYMLKSIYPSLGFGLSADVLHIAQFIDSAIKDGRLHLNKKSDIDTVYHDPCFLGRYLNIYDAPRNILAQTAALKEPIKTREYSNCCGAGLYHFRSKAARKVTEIAVENIRQTKAKQMITACPTCKRIFTEALKDKITVKDLTELV